MASPAQGTTLTRAEKVRHAYRIARNQLGDPYRYGAAGPRAFDCSGLSYYSYHRAGFWRLPRTSSRQARFARHIHRSRMRLGDLVFFYGGGGVYHVAMFAGWHNGHRIIIHSPHPGARVRRERIWTQNWFAGTLR
ncbi:MAG: NlpC/P60 family protein [Nocardioidaceae bacterium]|nr:NlpC/P60 family protein [Nocardioidaceae bacterium]NUS51124.1 NlpC/P60 family protein [Nocardioidaceae bacterium]